MSKILSEEEAQALSFLFCPMDKDEVGLAFRRLLKSHEALRAKVAQQLALLRELGEMLNAIARGETKIGMYCYKAPPEERLQHEDGTE